MRKTDLVIGQGPFVEVGEPTAVAVSDDLLVVAGDLGAPQWNARSVYDRSDRSVGWYPVAIYQHDLTCRAVLTSRWVVNSIALHPGGQLVAIGTGSYDGGYFYEGELLIHDLATGTTTSTLDDLRCVEHVAWADDGTLETVLAPPTDEDGAWTGPRSDRQDLRRTLSDLAAARGLTWELRRQVWALCRTDDGGITVGSESRIEHWRPQDVTGPAWRIDVDGTCVQLFTAAHGRVVASVWAQSDDPDRPRPTVAMTIDVSTGEHRDLVRSDRAVVLVRRSDGAFLVRDTSMRPETPRPAEIVTAQGEPIARVEVGGYDLFNHHFDIRGADDFLVLVGTGPSSHIGKEVAAVRSTDQGWQVRRLFPLAWEPHAHVFGGPGVLLDDAAGRSIVHAGAVHDGEGLLPGNAFVARRQYDDGRLVWHVPLDNDVTAIDTDGLRIVAVTNLGELVVIDAATGTVLHQNVVTAAGSRVVPLSLALEPPDTAWIGTFDGRVVQQPFLDAAPT